MVMLKLSHIGVKASCYRWTDRLIQKAGVAQCLDPQLQVRAVVRDAGNAGIEIEHVNLVHVGEKALR